MTTQGLTMLLQDHIFIKDYKSNMTTTAEKIQDAYQANDISTLVKIIDDFQGHVDIYNHTGQRLFTSRKAPLPDYLKEADLSTDQYNDIEDVKGHKSIVLSRVFDSNELLVMEMDLSLLSEVLSSANKSSMISGSIVIVVFMGLIYYLTCKITDPVVSIHHKINDLAHKTKTRPLEIMSRDEIGDIASTLNHLSDHIQEFIPQNINENENTPSDGNDNGSLETDPLTQILNRKKMDYIISQEVSKSKKTYSSFSILLIDIDHFRVINENHGHQVGDDVLVEFASILQSNIRNTDTLGRWGGEEFIILLKETSIEDALTKAEYLRKLIMNHDFNQVKDLTVSLGVSQYKPSMSLDDLVSMADKALYIAKESGRNRVSYVK